MLQQLHCFNNKKRKWGANAPHKNIERNQTMNILYKFSLLCALFLINSCKIESVGYLAIFRGEFTPTFTPTFIPTSEHVEPVRSREIDSIADSIRYKLDPNYVNDQGWNGLHWMLCTKSQNLELLLKSHAHLNFNQQADNGWTPTDLANIMIIDRVVHLIRRELREPRNPRLAQPLQSFFQQHPSIELDGHELVTSTTHTEEQVSEIGEQLLQTVHTYIQQYAVESQGRLDDPYIELIVKNGNKLNMLYAAMDKQQAASSLQTSSDHIAGTTDTENSQALEMLNHQIAWNETCLQETLRERMYMMRLLLLEEKSKQGLNETPSTHTIRRIFNTYPDVTLLNPDQLVSSPTLDEATRQNIENQFIEIGVALANQKTRKDYCDIFMDTPAIFQQRIAELQEERAQLLPYCQAPTKKQKL